MGICQGILNGEMITPTYQPVSPATSLPCLQEPSTPEEPLEEEGGGLDRLRGRPSLALLPGGVVAAPAPNPPYMNSAALNEIAGELLITVRELREELLQVGWRGVVGGEITCIPRSGRRGSGWSGRWCSRGSYCRSCAGRCCGCRCTAPARRPGRPRGRPWPTSWRAPG